MIQEEKELLLKDLCGRLPYSVKVLVQSWDEREMEYVDRVDTLYSINGDGYVRTTNEDCDFDPEEIKPYLLSMSSMTEDQKNEYYDIVNYISSDDTENWKEGEFIYVDQLSRLIHFYHRNHIDYLGLIPKGLAIDATDKNIY